MLSGSFDPVGHAGKNCKTTTAPAQFSIFQYRPHHARPDQKAREEILRLHLRGKPTEEDVERIAAKLDKFSGADIRTLVDRAVEEAIKRAMKSGKTERITTANLLDAAKGMRPTTEEWLATAHDYARYSNEGGAYDQVKPI